MSVVLKGDFLISDELFVVGVTGSGKGMTEVAIRGKHKFAPTDEPNA